MIEALAVATAVMVLAQLLLGLKHVKDRRWGPWRDTKGRALLVAARLHSDLHKELDRLEDRNRLLRAHVLRCAEPQGLGASPILGPDLLDGLHATMIADLRQRAESAYEGLDLEQGHKMEDRYLTLAELTAELTEMAGEIREREEAWGFLPAKRRSTRTGVVLIPPLRQGIPA